jgi:hypothetical protein
MTTYTNCLKLIVLLSLCAVVAAPTVGSTMIYDLEDDNSLLEVSSDQGIGMWFVDGLDQMSTQWFWYRVGDAPELTINTLDFDDVLSKATDTNSDGLNDVAYLLYHGLGFDVEVKVSLDGGPLDSGISDVAEQITVTNTSLTDPLDFTFFQYADFNLGADAEDDVVVHLGNGRQGYNTFTARQEDDADWVLRVAEVGSEPMTHCEANNEAALLLKLNDGLATDLNDVEQAGPDDVAWAYQWDFVLEPGDAFMLSKDKMITPEPATLALLGGGAAVALFLRRRRR